MPAFRPVTLRAAAAATLASVMMLSLLPAATLGYKEPPPETKQAEKQVLQLINEYRIDNRLSPLRMDWHVRRVARDRSRDMRDKDYFAHGSPTGRSAGTMMHNRGIRHWGWGENIGFIPYFGWDGTNRAMVDGWKNSSGHNALLLTREYNYIGVGIARNHKGAYYTLVFVKQPDHTPPRTGLYEAATGISVAAADSGPRSVTVRWWGHDRQLVKYTSGLRGFIVQKWTRYGWKNVRYMTTSRQMTVNLSRGKHTYRVKAVDRRGNRSPWAKVLRITVG
jgi:uncharacterized protein YkwD